MKMFNNYAIKLQNKLEYNPDDSFLISAEVLIRSFEIISFVSALLKKQS